MGKKLDFILKVEQEGGISTLNSFVHRRFDRSTNVWTDGAAHNILLFVLRGSAGCFIHDSATSQQLDGKVITLPRGSSFVLEFSPGAEILTYSFDSYLPMDLSLLGALKGAVSKAVAFDIRPRLMVELGSLYENLGLVLKNETYTLLSIRKVIESMRRCYSHAELAQLFSVLGQSESQNFFRYAQILENRENLTTKSFAVKF